MKTILIEKTAKRLKFYELIITVLLFISLFAGFGALLILTEFSVFIALKISLPLNHIFNVHNILGIKSVPKNCI